MALNWDDFLKFGAELPVGGDTVVIYEAKTGVAPDALPLVGVTPAEVFAVPIGEMARKATGSDKGKNSVVLGLLAGWFGIGREAILRRHPQEVREEGRSARRGQRAGVRARRRVRRGASARDAAHASTPPAKRGPKLLTDGNEMCAAAAIFAGCEFFGGYPITPSTEIMQFLTREIWKYGGAVLQAEDEIAGIGAALGASFAGKKAMTATSGPGMSLKTEILGLATIAELPLVVVNVQRGGPSTGMPTKSEQADLFQAVFSAHGDVVRPVLAPTCVADTFDVTVEAFNIAEHYQTPVIVLSDQEIAQRKEIVDPIDTSRFTLVERRRPTAAELAALRALPPDRRAASARSPTPAWRAATTSAPASSTTSTATRRRAAASTADEREAHPEARPAARSATTCSASRATRAAPLALVSWGSTRRRLPRGARARDGRGPARQAARAVPALPGREGVYRRFFAVRQGRARRRAVAPGPALPDAAHVCSTCRPG